VEEHDFFVRSDDDILCRVPISFVQAALGGTIVVPTLDDTEKIKIPRGTPSGRTFRLKGKGIPHLQGYGRGDQIIEVFVQVPTELTRKQEDLLRNLKRAANNLRIIRLQ
jgi:molecular chaperone DnaJ